MLLFMLLIIDCNTCPNVDLNGSVKMDVLAAGLYQKDLPRLGGVSIGQVVPNYPRAHQFYLLRELGRRLIAGDVMPEHVVIITQDSSLARALKSVAKQFTGVRLLPDAGGLKEMGY